MQMQLSINLNISKTNFQIIRQKVDKYVYNNNVEAPKIYINPEAYLTRIGQVVL